MCLVIYFCPVPLLSKSQARPVDQNEGILFSLWDVLNCNLQLGSESSASSPDLQRVSCREVSNQVHGAIAVFAVMMADFVNAGKFCYLAFHVSSGVTCACPQQWL